MNFKKGDIISNGGGGDLELQWVKLLSNMRTNYQRSDDFGREYPFRADVIHVKGCFVGEISEGYFISKESFLVKDSNEFFNRVVKPFEFA